MPRPAPPSKGGAVRAEGGPGRRRRGVRRLLRRRGRLHVARAGAGEDRRRRRRQGRARLRFVPVRLAAGMPGGEGASRRLARGGQGPPDTAPVHRRRCRAGRCAHGRSRVGRRRGAEGGGADAARPSRSRRRALPKRPVPPTEAPRRPIGPRSGDLVRSVADRTPAADRTVADRAGCGPCAGRVEPRPATDVRAEPPFQGGAREGGTGRDRLDQGRQAQDRGASTAAVARSRLAGVARRNAQFASLRTEPVETRRSRRAVDGWETAEPTRRAYDDGGWRAPRRAVRVARRTRAAANPMPA